MRTLTPRELMRTLPPRRLHPFCEIFPPMDEADFESLKTDIDDNGLLEPILLYEDQILDGRHRYRACTELGIEPSIEYYKGTPAEALSLVSGRNLHRRHLTASQKAAIAAEMATLWGSLEDDIAQNLSRRKNGETIPDEDRVDRVQAIADNAGVSRDTLSKAKKIKEQEPELLDRVKKGKLNVNQARKIADLPPETKAEALEKIDQGEPPKQVIKSVLHPGEQGEKNGGTNEHPTPDHIMEQVYDFLGEIDLDPASNDPPNVKCKKYFTKENDGLKQAWTGQKLWLNPPVSLSSEFSAKWVDYFSGNDAEGICLFKLDPRVEWFEKLIEHCAAFCIVRGYLKFKGSTASAPFGVILFYFGDRPDEFCDRFSVLGWCTDMVLQDEGHSDAIFPEIIQDGKAIQASSPDKPNIWISRFKTGDPVKVAKSLKLDVCKTYGLPDKKTPGTVIRVVHARTVEVKWSFKTKPDYWQILDEDLLQYG